MIYIYFISSKVCLIITSVGNSDFDLTFNNLASSSESSTGEIATKPQRIRRLSFHQSLCAFMIRLDVIYGSFTSSEKKKKDFLLIAKLYLCEKRRLTCN